MLRLGLMTLLVAGSVLVNIAEAAERSAKDQALYEKAVQDCYSARWPNGAQIVINYAGGWYRCQEPRDRN